MDCSLTWGGFWPRYIEKFSIVRHRPATTELHRICCRKLAEFFGDAPLTTITDGLIDDFVAWRKKQGVSNRTINIELAVLARAMAVAVRWEVLPAVPWRKMEKLNEGPLRVRFLTPDTRARLIAAAGDYREMILFFLLTGLRRGELRDLTWKDVDFHARVIWIRDSKTATARSVPLSPMAIDILRRLSHVRGIADAVVFVNPMTGQRYKDLSHVIKRVLVRAGLPDWTLHDLRHAFASQLAERGAQLSDLMEILGHRSPEMTRRYTHIQPQRIAGLLDGAAREIENWEQLPLESDRLKK